MLLLIVTLKQQQSGWTFFTAFVFTVVVCLLNVLFLFDTIKMAFHWLTTESRPILGEDWPTHFALIDAVMVVILLLLGEFELVYYLVFIKLCRLSSFLVY